MVSLLISSTSTDLAGIEYNMNGGVGAWTRYTGPISVSSGATVTYRSVDVNGNVEASNQITKP